MLLDKEAALVDSQLWINFLGKCIRQIYYFFGNFAKDTLLNYYLDLASDDEILFYFLDTVNICHINIPSIKLHVELSPSNLIPKYDFKAILNDLVINMYEFGSGGEINIPHFELEKNINNYMELTRRLSAMLYPTPQRGENSLENLISPRLVYGYKMFRIRLEFNCKLKDYLNFKNQNINTYDKDILAFTSNIGISPNDLALLAGVAYTFIIKLIKTNKLPAIKDSNGKNWLIPVNHAIKWLTTRPNCPKWVKDLEHH
ncbi:hypothetical protein [Desulforamulus putei]|uniref:hypothetical protein n=1 Tax=Desulforamulus putei TaxID=74701 RepID=UPI002FDCDDFA